MLGAAGVELERDVADVGSVDEMCRRLLANPLVEDYEILPSA